MAVGRYVKIFAKPGQGDALAAKLVEMAESLREAPGCELCVVNRDAGDADLIWVTEQWSTQEQMEAAHQAEETRESTRQAMELVVEGGYELTDLQPVGGVGYRGQGENGFAVINLDDVEDMAAKAGFGEMGEARFARGELGAQDTGLSLQRLRPGVRQSFGHLHHLDEELYVILAGSGQLAVDDEIRPVKRLDAIRVAPGSVRAFEAGPDGLDFLAMGTHHAGDAEMRPGFWPH
jgi:quinol monooxygenase YgiN